MPEFELDLVNQASAFYDELSDKSTLKKRIDETLDWIEDGSPPPRKSIARPNKPNHYVCFFELGTEDWAVSWRVIDDLIEVFEIRTRDLGASSELVRQVQSNRYSSTSFKY